MKDPGGGHLHYPSALIGGLVHLELERRLLGVELLGSVDVRSRQQQRQPISGILAGGYLVGLDGLEPPTSSV
jgi:hypothetical protein